MPEYNLTVTENKEIAIGIYRMELSSQVPIEGLHPGKFLNVSPMRPDILLKRPFGIYDYTKDGKELSFCYQVIGKGTAELSKKGTSDRLLVTAPLGNGFTLTKREKTVALIGGGVGIFPLNSLKCAYPDREYHSFLGFRSRENICLLEDFSSFSELKTATDDGSFGKNGNAVELFLENYERIRPDVILACGPHGMLKALKRALTERKIKTKTYISIEERMACGIGACLVCACKKITPDGVVNMRVCKDGPVFDIWEVEL